MMQNVKDDNFRTNSPYSVVISGIGMVCACASSLLLVFRVWGMRNGRWEKLKDENSFIYDNSASNNRKTVAESAHTNNAYDNAM